MHFRNYGGSARGTVNRDAPHARKMLLLFRFLVKLAALRGDVRNFVSGAGGGTPRGVDGTRRWSTPDAAECAEPLRGRMDQLIDERLELMAELGQADRRNGWYTLPAAAFGLRSCGRAAAPPPRC
jgi:hypothetical protein